MIDEPGRAEESLCKNCDKPIVFNYWKGVNGATYFWYHPPGNRTCLIKPDGWRGPWPLAEPTADPEFLGSLEEIMAEYHRTLHQLARWPGSDLR